MLRISIKSREKIYFEGEASVVSSVNETGAFDVLSEHANFITLINGKVSVIKIDGSKEDFSVGKGVLRVASDFVNIFVH